MLPVVALGLAQHTLRHPSSCEGRGVPSLARKRGCCADRHPHHAQPGHRRRQREAETVRPIHKIRIMNERYDPGGGGGNVARVVQDLGGDTLAI